jgi:hypothetical protein
MYLYHIKTMATSTLKTNYSQTTSTANDAAESTGDESTANLTLIAGSAGAMNTAPQAPFSSCAEPLREAK